MHKELFFSIINNFVISSQENYKKSSTNQFAHVLKISYNTSWYVSGRVAIPMRADIGVYFSISDCGSDSLLPAFHVCVS
jgi:hypothetical protein